MPNSIARRWPVICDAHTIFGRGFPRGSPAGRRRPRGATPARGRPRPPPCAGARGRGGRRPARGLLAVAGTRRPRRPAGQIGGPGVLRGRLPPSRLLPRPPRSAAGGPAEMAFAGLLEVSVVLEVRVFVAVRVAEAGVAHRHELEEEEHEDHGLRQMAVAPVVRRDGPRFRHGFDRASVAGASSLSRSTSALSS